MARVTAQAAYETCWCCGQSRWSVSQGWCPTCRSPAQPKPGVTYQTHQGPVLVPIGPAKSPTEERKQKRRYKSAWLIVAAAAVVLVVIALITPDKKAKPVFTPAEFAAAQADCERIATESLPAGLGVGGAHWTATVKSCLIAKEVDVSP